MLFELKYKVIDPYLKAIPDVDTSFDYTPIKIIQPLGAALNEYLDESSADKIMWSQSISSGKIKQFVDEKRIIKVYVDKENKKEINEEEYLKLNKNDSISEIEKLSIILKEKGISVNQLIEAISNIKSSDIETKQETSNVETKQETSDIETEYEKFSKLKYQEKLSFIKKITNLELLKKITLKEKQSLVVTLAAKRVEKLSKLTE